MLLATFPLCRALGEERFDPLFEVLAHVSLEHQVGAFRWGHLDADAAQRLFRSLQRQRRMFAERGANLHDPRLEPFFARPPLVDKTDRSRLLGAYEPGH